MNLKIKKEDKTKMSLTDILGGVVGICAFYKLMKEHYIPWTNEVQVEYDKEERKMKDDYRFSDEGKK